VDPSARAKEESFAGQENLSTEQSLGPGPKRISLLDLVAQDSAFSLVYHTKIAIGQELTSLLSQSLGGAGMIMTVKSTATMGIRPIK